MIKGIISLLFMLLMVVTFVVGVVFTVARSVFSMALNPDTRAWRNLLDKLRARLQKVAVNKLVPWDGDMASLLSLNRVDVKKPGWFDGIQEGVFTTIYHEPVLAYAGQMSGKNGVLLARTSDREFIFRMKGQETEIWINQQPFGVFVNGTLLAAGRGSRVLARLEASAAESQFPVLLSDNKTAATITNPERSSMPNPRALSLLRPLSPEEESTVLALMVLKATSAVPQK
ncbi:MAG TPA: hypothetical protein PK971_17285 [Saprospiraceae bacterium]|nr:hypothetical protein [Saprospiraceae bacterium]